MSIELTEQDRAQIRASSPSLTAPQITQLEMGVISRLEWLADRGVAITRPHVASAISAELAKGR